MVLVGIFIQLNFEPNPRENSFKDDFQKRGLAYHEFHRVRKHSPPDLDELQDFLNNPPATPKQTSIVSPDPVFVVILPDSIVEMVGNGRIKVIRGDSLVDSGLEHDKSLLAYRSDIATKGGFALMAAGRTLELTPEAFKKYPLVTIIYQRLTRLNHSRRGLR